MKHTPIIFGLIFAMLTLIARGDVPVELPYQGKLTETNGDPVNDTVDLEFNAFDADTGGNLLWTQTNMNVVVTNGLFSTTIGDSNLVSALTNAQVWVEVTVDGTDTLLPRTRLLAVPYAVKAAEADALAEGVLEEEVGAILDNRFIGCKVFASGPINIQANAQQTLVFPIEQYDIGDNWNTTTGQFTCDSAGLYKFEATVDVRSVQQYLVLGVVRNGQWVHVKRVPQPSGGNYLSISISTTIPLGLGDVAEFKILTPQSSPTQEVSQFGTYNFAEIRKVH